MAAKIVDSDVTLAVVINLLKLFRVLIDLLFGQFDGRGGAQFAIHFHAHVLSNERERLVQILLSFRFGPFQFFGHDVHNLRKCLLGRLNIQKCQSHTTCDDIDYRNEKNQVNHTRQELYSFSSITCRRCILANCETNLSFDIVELG